MKLSDLQEELHYYNNIEGLRGLRTKVKKKTLLEELQFERGRNDIVWWMENFYYVNSIDDGYNLIKLRDYQEEAVEMVFDNAKSILLWGRQSGKSVLIAGVILHAMCYNDNYKVGIASLKLDGAVEVLSILKDAYIELPIWMQQPIVKWNDGEIKMSNKNRVICDATSKTSFRGKTLNMVYIDELAFIGDELWKDFSKSIAPTLSSGKKIKLIYTSTPQGFNQFYYICRDAMEGKSTFKIQKVIWSDIEGRDEEWKENTIRDIDAVDKLLVFRQEYCCEFISGGSSFIDAEDIKKMIEKDDLLTDSMHTQIYHQPIDGHTYVMGVDVATGKKGDFSVIQILDITNMNRIKQVCKFRSNTISTIFFPGVIEHLSKLYNNAYTLIENNSYGDGVINSLFMDFEFENLLSNDIKKGIGIYTSKKTKPVILSNLKYYITSGKLEVCDRETIKEFGTFVTKLNGSVEADSSSHDDCIMALGIAMYIVKLNGVVDIDIDNIVREIKQEAVYTIMV